jgi:hypothetical protein
MGHASNAVFWGGDPDYWGNPALLGYYDGVRHDWGKTQLLPGIKDDVSFEANRLTFAAFGVGLSSSGDWSGIGGMRLDYGIGIGLTPSDRPWEGIRSWGVGVSAARLLDNALGLAGARLPALSRYGDVALGHTTKQVDLALQSSPSLDPSLGPEGGSVSTKDRGVLVRLTPYDAIGYPGRFPGLDRIARARLDLSYGGSTLNYNDASAAILAIGGSFPVERISRHGFAARLALDPSVRLQSRLDAHGAGWLSRFLGPALSIAAAWDNVRYSTRDPETRVRTETSRSTNSGCEISLLNVFTYRFGSYGETGNAAHVHTAGWSLGLAYRDLAGFRYDRASVPMPVLESTGEHFPDRPGKAFNVFVDPIRLLGELYRYNSRR